eukprot:4674134-Amphidinium_carterae.1
MSEHKPYILENIIPQTARLKALLLSRRVTAALFCLSCLYPDIYLRCRCTEIRAHKNSPKDAPTNPPGPEIAGDDLDADVLLVAEMWLSESALPGPGAWAHLTICVRKLAQCPCGSPSCYVAPALRVNGSSPLMSILLLFVTICQVHCL